MRRRPLILGGVLAALFVGWALADAKALRTAPPIDSDNNMARLVSLHIEAQHPTIGPGDYAHIAVTLRNAHGGPIQLQARDWRRNPVEHCFEWVIEGPDGRRLTRPFTDPPEEIIVRVSGPVRLGWLEPFHPDWGVPTRELLGSGESLSFFLDAPMARRVTAKPGTYRLALAYRVMPRAVSDSLPTGYWTKYDDADDVPMAVGLVTSNTITVTRTAGK